MDSKKDPPLPGKASKSRVNKACHQTSAARWNNEMLNRLKAALRKDPEADITTLLSPTYSKQLLSFKRPAHRQPASSRNLHSQPQFHSHDIRSRLDVTDPATIIFELSAELEALLQTHDDLSEAIIDLLAESEVLYECAWAASVMVFRVSKSITVKITNAGCAVTEYRSLSYLKDRLPDFPAPRPHGLIRLGIFHLLFTTFIPGLDLEKAWPQLEDTQKTGVSTQLDALLCNLRSLPFPHGTPLGGVQGEGCKDMRRGVRTNTEPIMNVTQFEDFIFAGSKTASPMYTELLRGLVPTSPAKCVFTHGDIRPANIMVEADEDGTWRIISIIDWEASGFYPEYWECVKMTNNLTPRDNDDWYKYLPKSLSPSRYPIQWLVDRLWDRNMVNS